MTIKFSDISGAGGSTTGFAIDTGDGSKTDVSLSKEYPAGGYQISSANGNQGLFIFFGAPDGTPAGGTASKSIVATKSFNKITIIGVTANDLITFTYKETATLNAVGTSSSYSGAVVTSFSPNQISSINDTVILNGAALGTNVTVKFTGANGTPLNAKSITRVSDTQLIVTRPDTMPGDQDPYKITVQNPGIEPAVSTNVLSQPLYAGAAPVWSTAATLPAFSKNVSYTQQLIASDPDGTAITYSFVNGSLPAGLTYAANSSTISGTPTGSTSASFTIRATEASGRYSDRTFTLPDAYPVFTTGPTLSPYTKNVSYSTTIVASDDSGVSPSLSVVGTMPTGLSFNALTGSVTGTMTSTTNQTFTIRATDANGSTTDQVFTIPNIGPVWNTASGSIGSIGRPDSFSTTLSVTDDGTVTYSVVSGALPTGLSLNSSTGVISGTATVDGTFNFTIRVTDNNSSYSDRTFSITVQPSIAAAISSGLGSTDYTLASGNIRVFDFRTGYVNGSSVIRTYCKGGNGGNISGSSRGGYGAFLQGDVAQSQLNGKIVALVSGGNGTDSGGGRPSGGGGGFSGWIQLDPATYTGNNNASYKTINHIITAAGGGGAAGPGDTSTAKQGGDTSSIVYSGSPSGGSGGLGKNTAGTTGYYPSLPYAARPGNAWGGGAGNSSENGTDNFPPGSGGGFGPLAGTATDDVNGTWILSGNSSAQQYQGDNAYNGGFGGGGKGGPGSSGSVVWRTASGGGGGGGFIGGAGGGYTSDSQSQAGFAGTSFAYSSGIVTTHTPGNSASPYVRVQIV